MPVMFDELQNSTPDIDISIGLWRTWRIIS